MYFELPEKVILIIEKFFFGFSISVYENQAIQTK